MKCGLFSKYEYSVAVCFIAIHPRETRGPDDGDFFSNYSVPGRGWGFFSTYSVPGVGDGGG